MTTPKRIDFNKYKQVEEVQVGGGKLIGSLRETMCKTMEIREVINLVKEGNTTLWVSNGNWSMHQLLMAILDITGPADVYISSYALSETPARIISQLKDSGLIKKLTCVLDNRVDTRTAGTLQLMKSIADDFALLDTHAKVTVIRNDNHNITVVGSANYTENRRYEAGVVICTKAAADFQINWILKGINDGIK
jgi:hypothetical protein